MKVLVSDVLSQIAADVLPANPALQLPYLNRVLETFFSVGKFARMTQKWKGTSTGVSFQVCYDQCGQAYITLPRNVLSLLAAGYGSTNNQPTPNYRVRFSSAPIQGFWHEFANGYGGIGDETWGRQLADAGDGWTCFQDILEPSYLRIVCETSETSGANILFQGEDQNGNDIYSVGGSNNILGVNLNFGASLTTQTTQIFGGSPSLVQKPITNGPLSLYAVSVSSGSATLISVFAPGDTAPGFRRYKLGSVSNRRNGQPYIPYTTVHAVVKRRFVAVAAMSDEVIPGNISAIELGMMGRKYDLQGDIKTSTEYWMDAISLLNSELNEYNGAAVPQIIWQRGTNPAARTFIN